MTAVDRQSLNSFQVFSSSCSYVGKTLSSIKFEYFWIQTIFRTTPINNVGVLFDPCEIDTLHGFEIFVIKVGT